MAIPVLHGPNYYSNGFVFRIDDNDDDVDNNSDIEKNKDKNDMTNLNNSGKDEKVDAKKVK